MNIARERFGHETFSDLDSIAKLQKIAQDPEKFKISVVLALLEHFSIIALAIMLFIAFSLYSPWLAVVWTISRTGEALIQIVNKKSYWGLLPLAMWHSGAEGAETEKDAAVDAGRRILEAKNSSFTFAQILFSIGTIAYSALFIVHGVLPPVIGWAGVAGGILYGFGNGILLMKPNVKILWNIGGQLVWLFEIALGGWLLFFAH